MASRDLGERTGRNHPNENYRLPDSGTLEGGIDAGATDLGDDVNRDMGNSGSTISPDSGTLEGGIDARLADLGDDANRSASEG